MSEPSAKRARVDAEAGYVKLTIATLDGQCVEILADPYETVEYVRPRIADRVGVPENVKIDLLCGSRALADVDPGAAEQVAGRDLIINEEWQIPHPLRE